MDAASLGRVMRRSLTEGDLVEDLWQSYSARASELVSELSIPEAARLAAAFSTARLVDFDFFARLSSRTLDCLRAPEQEGGPGTYIAAADLRRLALAYGRARAFDTELMEALVPVIAARVGDFRPRDLARIADAYARMPVQSPDLFALVADAIPSYLYDLEPAELASLCRAFAEVAVYNQELTDALCAEVVQRLRSFGALECLIFLEGLSRLNAGLPEDLRRNDSETITSVVEQLTSLLSSLAVADLIRVFSALVRLDHYNPQLVHGRLCPALAQKLSQLQGPGAFAELAELLHCLSLLPAQSHKSAELALATAGAMRRGGLPRGRLEPRALALAVAALAQLGQEDDELMALLASAVRPHPEPGTAGLNGRSGGALPELVTLASDAELLDLERAFALSAKECVRSSRVLEDALAALREELINRGDTASAVGDVRPSV